MPRGITFGQKNSILKGNQISLFLEIGGRMEEIIMDTHYSYSLFPHTIRITIGISKMKTKTMLFVGLILLMTSCHGFKKSTGYEIKNTEWKHEQ